MSTIAAPTWGSDPCCSWIYLVGCCLLIFDSSKLLSSWLVPVDVSKSKFSRGLAKHMVSNSTHYFSPVFCVINATLTAQNYLGCLSVRIRFQTCAPQFRVSSTPCPLVGFCLHGGIKQCVYVLIIIVDMRISEKSRKPFFEDLLILSFFCMMFFCCPHMLVACVVNPIARYVQF